MHLGLGAAAVAADPALRPFHPCVQAWFAETLGEPTEPQRQAWPLIAAGSDVLIAAPTGSGKTLSAFLSSVDRLFCLAADQKLESKTYILYVSPLKALGNDVQKNLLAPLQAIMARAKAAGLAPQDIRVDVRSGDTSAADRARMVKTPPHILITTPESLYLCLTAEKARERLRQVETVIVDEIHALIRDKRGSHFALSLERLKALVGQPVQLVGLSATTKPVERVAAFLAAVPEAEARARVKCIEVGHIRPWDLAIETPDSELSAVATHEMWGQIYERLLALTATHRTILVFTNTRKLAERVAHDLGERMGKDLVAAHHGSMARELRLSAEERLKSGALRVMVATASLELGIDVGSIDLVVQLGSPRAIAVMLQRVGRAGHHKAAISKGILFAMTRDELVECAALLWAIRQRQLDQPIVPVAPLDVLAQQLVAMVAAEEWREDRLFETVRRAWPYRDLSRAAFEQVVQMLAEGVATSRGRARALLHRDRVGGMLRPRKGARLTALQNAGAIPDTFDYPVINEIDGKTVGSVNEDWAIESAAGDVFVLGSTSWRITRVMAGTVRVVDAEGQAPSIPFWLGEAPARTAELSEHVGRLREAVVAGGEAFLIDDVGLRATDATVLSAYLRVSAKVLSVIPSQTRVVAERFFDEGGGMQLIIHAPFGGRINRAWGMALRKRFCRNFDFELQAAAGDDGILLSLSEQHSFPLIEIFDFLSPGNVEEVLKQAILQAPLFGTRFRWNATRALMLDRMRNGERVPPQIQRMRSDDLLASVFPAQVGCQDNHGGGDIEPPDHPLVNETMDNCLREALDVDGLRAVLLALREGRIERFAVDLPEPSPLAHQHLNSAPYTFLDDAPLEERRARAVSVRRSLSPEDAVAFGALDELAIRQVIADAAPLMRDPDEAHDALLSHGLMREETIDPLLLEPLFMARRAAVFSVGEARFLVAAERLPIAQALFPAAVLSPALALLPGDQPMEREAAVLAVVRGRLEVCGPTTAADLGRYLGLAESEVLSALLAVEAQGQVLRGTFWPGGGGGGGGGGGWDPSRSDRADRGSILTGSLSPPSSPEHKEFCDRRLLQRIHRLTVGRLRKEIEPLSSGELMRFLFRWHHVVPDALSPRGRAGLLEAVAKLEGYEAPGSQWEHALFRKRVQGYDEELLDLAGFSGEVAWGRLSRRVAPKPSVPRRGAVVVPLVAEEIEAAPSRAVMSRNASLSFVRRSELDWMIDLARPAAGGSDTQLALDLDASEPARAVADVLARRGASFFLEIVQVSGLLPAVVEDALSELLARGAVSADAVDNLRVLQSPKRRKRQKQLQRGGPGRWWLLRPSARRPREELLTHVAALLLRRYGIVWRDLVAREPLAPAWRELAFVYRRMEARGEIRGGRFIGGVVGEQFALPEAVDKARAVRRERAAAGEHERVELAAVDPLNLTGVLPGSVRVPAIVGKSIVYVDGVPEQAIEAAVEDESEAGAMA
ncbi:MAG: DEAD/DEAH box helicase [Deltaproteobacteria bacterium]|nr:DEAD/DEAH box helicase [Deltaproteobacteria bacterium]